MGQEESDQNLGPFLSKKTSYKISAQFVEKWLPSGKLQFGLSLTINSEAQIDLIPLKRVFKILF